VVGDIALDVVDAIVVVAVFETIGVIVIGVFVSGNIIIGDIILSSGVFVV